MEEQTANTKIRLGISACLLGQLVRFDGGHQHDRYITQTLGRYVDFVPVCPEVDCGLSIPREAMRLVGDIDHPRLVTIRSRIDYTEQMQTWAYKRVKELESENLNGFIFKSDSPSSGMERVKVYDDKGMPVKKGIGMFARAFMEHFPLLPVEEEGRLHDPKLRENFIEAIFTFKRWRDVVAARAGRKQLVEFHSRHKLLILSHSPEHYREMGRVVAHVAERPLEETLARYQELLLSSLRLKTTIKKNANVLYHLLGYFKEALSADEKQELLEIIDNYRQGQIPLIVPITLVSHYVRKYRQPYLKEQYYLHPHPLELQLRNHA